jgi:hypothetical protein
MKKYFLLLVAACSALACSRENEDLVLPTNPADFPLQLVLDSDEEGAFEDSDETEMAFTFTDRFDPTGKELGGVLKTLSSPVKVSCQITDLEGFSTINEYILGLTAYYEIDDCTTSEDNNLDLDLAVDYTTGVFSFTFPAQVEEVKIAFELNDALFDDGVQNDDRGFSVEVLGIENAMEEVVINTDQSFEHKVLDDEYIFGEYALEFTEENFTKLKELFGGVNADIANTAFNEVEAVEFEFSLEELAVKVVLIETEMVTECGDTEEENVAYEVEGEYESLTEDDVNGEIEFVVALEDESGAVEEISFSGTFSISGDDLQLTLETEDAAAVTLILKK